MRHTTLRHALIAVGTLLAISITGLWSWNTLAVLFDAPTAEFRHVLAFLVLLAIVRFTLVPRQHRRARRIFTNSERVT